MISFELTLYLLPNYSKLLQIITNHKNDQLSIIIIIPSSHAMPGLFSEKNYQVLPTLLKILR